MYGPKTQATIVESPLHWSTRLIRVINPVCDRSAYAFGMPHATRDRSAGKQRVQTLTDTSHDTSGHAERRSRWTAAAAV